MNINDVKVTQKLVTILDKRNPSDKERRHVIDSFLPQLKNKCFNQLNQLEFGQGFPSPTQVVYQLLRTELQCISGGWDEIQKGLTRRQTTAFQWGNLKKYDIPIRRVSPNTWDLINTCPGPTWVPLWTEDTTPKFPTTHYILPSKALIVEKWEIMAITVSIFTGEKFREELIRQYGVHNHGKIPAKTPEMSNQMMVTVHASDGTTSWSTGQAFEKDVLEKKKLDPNSTGDLSTSELSLLERLNSIAIQLLLLENTKPEFDVPERVERRHSGSGKTTSVCYPKLIGGNLNRLTHGASHTPNEKAIGESTRKRPKEHWRGAHWKQVAYGPNHSLRKAKLILPCIVNPETEP